MNWKQITEEEEKELFDNLEQVRSSLAGLDFLSELKVEVDYEIRLVDLATVSGEDHVVVVEYFVKTMPTVLVCHYVDKWKLNRDNYRALTDNGVHVFVKYDPFNQRGVRQ